MEIPELTKRIDALYNKGLFTELTLEEQAELDELNKEFNAKLMDLVVNQKQARDEKSREMKNRRRRGKYHEKKTASDLHQTRDGGVGRIDSFDDMFSTENKVVTKFPATLEKYLSQAHRLAKQDTIEIVVLKRGREGRVYLDLSDWKDLHGGG